MVRCRLAFLYFSLFAIAVLRWGFTTLAVGVFVTNLLLAVPATASVSTWYVGETLLVLGIAVAIATWAVYTAIAGRRWSAPAPMSLSGRSRAGGAA